jgi:hypothetical protein
VPALANLNYNELRGKVVAKLEASGEHIAFEGSVQGMLEVTTVLKQQGSGSTHYEVQLLAMPCTGPRANSPVPCELFGIVHVLSTPPTPPGQLPPSASVMTPDNLCQDIQDLMQTYINNLPKYPQ